MPWMAMAFTAVGGMAWDIARRYLDERKYGEQRLRELRGSITQEIGDHLRAVARDNEANETRLRSLWERADAHYPLIQKLIDRPELDAPSVAAFLEEQKKWNTTTDKILEKLHKELPLMFKGIEEQFFGIQKQISDKVVGVKHAAGYGK